MCINFLVNGVTSAAAAAAVGLGRTQNTHARISKIMSFFSSISSRFPTCIIYLTHEAFLPQHLFDLLHVLSMLQIAPPVKAAPTSFPLHPRQFPIIPLAVYRILHPFLPVERVSTINENTFRNQPRFILAIQNCTVISVSFLYFYL
jgi:hypothetical protein